MATRPIDSIGSSSIKTKECVQTNRLTENIHIYVRTYTRGREKEERSLARSVDYRIKPTASMTYYVLGQALSVTRPPCMKADIINTCVLSCFTYTIQPCMMTNGGLRHCDISVISHMRIEPFRSFHFLFTPVSYHSDTFTLQIGFSRNIQSHRPTDSAWLCRIRLRLS